MRPETLPLQLTVFIVVTGISLAVVAVCSIWATLGTPSPMIRFSVLGAVALLTASIHPVFFGSLHLVAPRWHAALPGLIAGFLVGSLLIYQAQGYRFGRIDGRPGTIGPTEWRAKWILFLFLAASCPWSPRVFLRRPVRGNRWR